MGYPNDSHIKKFVKGQTVEDISQDKDGIVWLTFKSGEKLRLYGYAVINVMPTVKVITTPYNSSGEVKPSTEIEKQTHNA